MSAPTLRILSSPPPETDPIPWADQLADALAAALLEHSNLETRIYLGEGGLALRRAQAERRVKALTTQLAEELARGGQP